MGAYSREGDFLARLDVGFTPMTAEEQALFRRVQDDRGIERLCRALPFGALAMAVFTAMIGVPEGPKFWIPGVVVTVITCATIWLARAPWFRVHHNLLVAVTGLGAASGVGLFASATGGFHSPVMGALVLLWLFAAVAAPLTPSRSMAHGSSQVLTTSGVLLALCPRPGSPAVFLVISAFGLAFLLAGLSLRERSDAHAFLLQRRLDDANRALSDVNAELERRVDQQVAEIRERARDVEGLNAQLQQRVIDRSRELALAIARLARPARLGSPPVGTVLNGRFELVRCIDEGGMGEVFEGFDRVAKIKVAVKTIHGNHLSDVSSLQRFVTEARAAAAVRHEGIVRTLDIDVTEDGTLFHVMELLSGETLADVLDRPEPRPLGTIARLACVIARALAAAHAAGVVHRDVKPANIMLTPDPPGAKLLDFGIAKLRGASLDGAAATQAVTILGTPAYMAPEQALDPASVSPAADVYSFGVVLYEALTSVLPHEGTDASKERIPQATSAPVDLSSRNRDVPAALAAAVMRCLCRSAESRPTALEVAAALLPFVDSEVVLPFSTPVDAHARTEAISSGTAAEEEGEELDAG
jgi:tRNA A-37 threonylcarbamoyl transferase component Bud32